MSPQHRLGERRWLAPARPDRPPGGSAWPPRPRRPRRAGGGQDPGAARPSPQAGRLGSLADEADRLRTALVEQERTDAGVYERMVATVRAARATDGDPGAARAAEAARADATEVPLATAELAADGLGLAAELAGMALARTASDQLVAAHLLRAGLEGGISTIAFNLRRMAAGPVRDDLAARAGRLEDARRAAAALTERLTAMVEQP
jgi:formiminotetrahydrofolate cyclodeaminase